MKALKINIFVIQPKSQDQQTSRISEITWHTPPPLAAPSEQLAVESAV